MKSHFKRHISNCAVNRAELGDIEVLKLKLDSPYYIESGLKEAHALKK